ncbi:MAG TPA: condensation domain-containing protein, partial [Vicinamibacterales bacterium]|nr:condensation domain-containing protein [Vicinamibacterales bacterium]
MTVLTPIQAGMLVHCLKTPDSGADIEQMVATLDHEVEPSALAAAWQQLVTRHEAFRSRFEWAGLTRPRRVVEAAVRLPWLDEDWRSFDPATHAARLDAFLAADRTRGFDPAVAPLARAALFRLADNRWQFVWTFHHILADGQSYADLVTEGFDLCDAGPGGATPAPPDPPSFARFTDWLEARLQTAGAEASAFWRSRVGAMSAPTRLPLLAAAAPSGPILRRERAITLDVPVTAALGATARAAGATRNTAVQAAWALVLAWASGEPQ